MSLKLVIGEDYPRRWWMLDDYPLIDCSGYEKHATSGAKVTNLVTNPSIELNTTGWGVSSNANIARSTSYSFFGSASLLVSRKNTTPGNCYAYMNIPTVVGKTYTFAAMLMPVRTGMRMHAGFGGPYINITGSLNVWTEYRLTFTATATSTTIFVSDDATSTWTVGDCFYMDAVTVFEGTNAATPLFDGTNAHVAKNLVNAPYGGAGLWQGRWWGGGTATGTHSDEVGPTPVGNKFKRKTWTNAGAASSGDTGFDVQQSIPVVAGQTYTVSGWMRASAADPNRKLYAGIYWVNTAGSNISRVGSSNAIAITPGEWQYVTTTAVAPAGAIKAHVQLDVQGGSTSLWAVGDTLDGTGATFNLGSVAKPPTNVPTTFTSWTGAVDASTSTLDTFNFGPSLVKGAERSMIVNNSNKIFFDTPVFKKNKEYLSFSVEAFVRPVTADPATAKEIQIFGNDGVMDGLVMNGTVVSFVTKYADGTEARASYDLMDEQAFSAVGVHTLRKNLLYINGEDVASVDITPTQQASTFLATGAVQSSGSSTGTNSIMMNSVSVYDLELDDESAMTHFANAQDTLGAEDVAIDYKGALLEFAPEGALAPFFQIEYSSEAEWALGHRVNCAINDGTLYPAVSQGVSVAGYWETVVPLGLSSNQIYAANLLWEGTGATVSTSRDGIEWTTAQKGKALTTVPKGTNGSGEFLYIRVAFPGGYANDKSSFDNMVFSLYMTGTITNFSGREVVLDKATPEDDTDVIDYHQNWGVEMEAGTVTIKAPVGDMGVKARTIEVWAQKLKGTTFTDNLGSAARIRSNGGEYKPYADGEWQLRHYVFDADFTGDIVLSGTGQIGHVVLYPQSLSDAVIKEIYDSYTGKPKIYVEVDEVFDVHEFNGQVDIYEYDWSIESSG